MTSQTDSVDEPVSDEPEMVGSSWKHMIQGWLRQREYYHRRVQQFGHEDQLVRLLCKIAEEDGPVEAHIALEDLADRTLNDDLRTDAFRRANDPDGCPECKARAHDEYMSLTYGEDDEDDE
jgi:hypothetical protein